MSLVKPDEFSQVLGPSVRPKGASIEMTDDKPTSAIGAKLPVLMSKLREEAKLSRIERLDDPFGSPLANSSGIDSPRVVRTFGIIILCILTVIGGSIAYLSSPTVCFRPKADIRAAALKHAYCGRM